jgi:hypothetical protein
VGGWVTRFRMEGLELGYKQLSPKTGLVHLWCVCVCVCVFFGLISKIGEFLTKKKKKK